MGPLNQNFEGVQHLLTNKLSQFDKIPESKKTNGMYETMARLMREVRELETEVNLYKQERNTLYEEYEKQRDAFYEESEAASTKPALDQTMKKLNAKLQEEASLIRKGTDLAGRISSFQL